jgi:hypothetical protein
LTVNLFLLLPRIQDGLVDDSGPTPPFGDGRATRKAPAELKNLPTGNHGPYTIDLALTRPGREDGKRSFRLGHKEKKSKMEASVGLPLPALFSIMPAMGKRSTWNIGKTEWRNDGLTQD